MKRTPWLLAVWLLVVSPLSMAVVPSDACMTNASESLDAVARGDFKSAGKDFVPAFASEYPPVKIEQGWNALQASAGAYQRHGVATIRSLNGQTVLVTPVTFAHAEWDFVYACNDHDQITMASLMPAAQLDQAMILGKLRAESKAPVQAQVEADGVRVVPLPVTSPFGPLRGALTLPAGKGPFPAVVLVAGSGPDDLDETVGGSKTFRDVADGLAKAGIASLRYDKRATDYGLRVAANLHLTVAEEETDDALAAARLLARQKQVDPRRVFVLGHSEGGMLAPRIGKRDPVLAGIIMLAAPARPLLTVLEEQTREQGARMGLPKANIEASEKALAGEKALLDKADPKHPPQGAFGGAPQTWWLSLRDYHQVAVAKKLTIPMLILQGGSDFQVSPTKDFNAWKKTLAGKPDVTFHLYPGLSHLFTPAGKTLTMADYMKSAHVDPKVIHDIATWIKAQPPAK